ncbi:TerY-C metal binding domain-containing protein [Agitococcus lubricus]|uniref:Uncharacterized protein YegL n=1 Tax=Agitococcus lubricus TaxID=1077255 RepID=A0A2T5J2K9_9GAMM|nr:TerY-C metal binding domain-containing protein [Agitococcus lubricus]PTQ90754.1 uncharacterized protein YegL [Agitococcus lubricus]
MRRLPIFFLLDVSESMAGDNLRQLQHGLERLVASLRTDPYALETVYLSIIAFAGKAKTLTPLVDVASFYPPRLPVGSGTALGAALSHLMAEIDQQVLKTTPERKGDWKPVVYLMTDGKPTDHLKDALYRWQKYYQHQASLVAIGVGEYADLNALAKLTPHVVHLNAQNEDDFKRFIDWVSQSVVAQSRSVSAQQNGVSLAKLDDSILSKLGDLSLAAKVDEDYVILSGVCQRSRLPYLIKYERLPMTLANGQFNVDFGRYHLVGVMPLERDYYELCDDSMATPTINTDLLVGAAGCPHCGHRYALAACGNCNNLLCIGGEGEAICPHCQYENDFVLSTGDGFDISRARG